MRRPINCWHCAAPRLTDRDIRILCLLAGPEELTAEEIGGRIGVSRQTVKNTLSDLYRALGVKGRVGVIRKVIEWDLKASAA